MDKVQGQVLSKAQSSLKAFAIYFESGNALLLSGVKGEEGPDIEAVVKPSSQVPEQSEAVCSVDWSWIYGKTVENCVRINDAGGVRYRLMLKGGPTITISVGLWQGDTFLSFMPYKPN